MNRSRFLSLMLLLNLATLSNAQIIVDEKYEQYQPVEYSLQETGANSQAIWELKPLSRQTRFTTRQYRTTDDRTVNVFWGEPGQYQLEATVVTVDFDKRIFDIKKYSKIFSIGSVTPTPPGPNPPSPTPPGPNPPTPSPIPADKFNNIGQRINAKAIQDNLQQDVRTRIAEIYSTTAKGMFPPNQRFFRVVEASQFITDEINKLSLNPSWGGVRGLVLEEANKWSGANTLSWEEVANFYTAVSLGYKGE